MRVEWGEEPYRVGLRDFLSGVAPLVGAAKRKAEQVVHDRGDEDEDQESLVPPTVEDVTRRKDSEVLQPHGLDLPIADQDEREEDWKDERVEAH